ncbi:MAG: aldo/keto reductase [Eubacteriales bacterium]
MYQAQENRYDSMTYGRCGQSGLLLPRLSLGFWHNFGSAADRENMKAMCRTAFDGGITHFDLANNYGPAPGAAEENLGRILREDFSRYRDQLLISTKAGYPMWEGPYGRGGSRKYLLASLNQSLLRMGLDYVDIFYHHCPDPNTPLEETMGALASAVRSGKALYVGLSNYNGVRMTEAASMLRQLRCPFVINQNAYSLLNRTIERNGLKEASGQAGVGIISYSPLAQGMLTDRYLHGIPADSRAAEGRFLSEKSLTPEKLAQIDALRQLAARRGQSLAQLALSWVLRDEVVVSALIGASRPAQITENLAALRSAPLSEEELRDIDRIVGA